jgi:hypothetical protein
MNYKMKVKILNFLNKVYTNGWFNLFSVMTATVLGLLNTWPCIVFLMLYGAGFAVVNINQPSVVTPVASK